MTSHCLDCLLEGGGGFIGKKIVCDPLVFKLFYLKAPPIVQHNTFLIQSCLFSKKCNNKNMYSRCWYFN